MEGRPEKRRRRRKRRRRMIKCVKGEEKDEMGTEKDRRGGERRKIMKLR